MPIAIDSALTMRLRTTRRPITWLHTAQASSRYTTCDRLAARGIPFGNDLMADLHKREAQSQRTSPIWFRGPANVPKAGLDRAGRPWVRFACGEE